MQKPDRFKVKMKRSDDGRVIKIPDANAVAAATGGVVSGGGPLGQQNSATITPIYPQRPDMPQQPSGGVPLQQHPLQAHRAGVTVYRGEPTGMVSSAPPPAAHTGVVVTASPSPGGAVPQQQQPPSVVMHGPLQAVVAQQASGTIKPEPISKIRLLE